MLHSYFTKLTFHYQIWETWGQMELKVFLSICSESLMDIVNLQTEKVTFFQSYLTMELSPHKNEFHSQVLHGPHFGE